VKILFLLPLCFVFSAGWIIIAQLAAGSSLAGSTRTYPARVSLIIAHLDAAVSGWDVRTYYFGDLTAQQATFHIDVVSRDAWRDPFSDQPTVERSLELRITRVSGNGDRGTGIVRSAFEREFGSDWTRMAHPELLSRVVPVIETAAFDAFSPRRSVTTPRITSRLSSTSPLTLEWIATGPRINWFGATLGWTLLLWLVLSVAVLIQATLSKERKARRWVAMKCPKCGYERQRERDECPECGLVYERPSYVMWDPTEDDAASPRAETASPRPSPAGGEGEVV
jgi:hypothetical protein